MIEVHELNGGSAEVIAVYDNGGWVRGADEMEPIFGPEPPERDELLGTLDGPRLFCVDENPPQPDTGVEGKSWVPYEGPQGGEGWKNAETGNIVYDDEPPGEALATEMPPEPDEWNEADASDFEEGDWAAFEVDGDVFMGQVHDTSSKENPFGETKHYAKFTAVSPESVAGEEVNVNPYRDNLRRAPAGAGDEVSGEREADETAEDDEAEQADVDVSEIDSWRSMGDDEVRAVIEEVHEDGDPTRREVYDIIGTPPTHGGEYEEHGVDPMDMADTTSDVATNYGSVEEFREARESGSLDRAIESTYEAMGGDRLNMDALPEDAADSIRDEVRNHVVFDLIWHHRLGRSDELYEKAAEETVGVLEKFWSRLTGE